MTLPGRRSVVITTFNRGTYVRDAVASVVPQLAPVDEIIVVDNGSSDGTDQVVASLALEHGPRLRSLVEPRNGLNIARDSGVKAATSDIVAFLDDDAVAQPSWLAELSRAFHADPSVEVVAGRVELKLEAERPAWLTVALEGYLSSTRRFGSVERPLLEDEFPVGANMAVRRDAWRRHGGFGHGLGRNGRSLMSNAEFALCQRIREAGGTVLYAPASAVWHRVPPGRLSLRWFLRRSYWQGRSDARWRAAGPYAVALGPAAIIRHGLGVAGDLAHAASGLARRRPSEAVDRLCFASSRCGFAWQQFVDASGVR